MIQRRAASAVSHSRHKEHPAPLSELSTIPIPEPLKQHKINRFIRTLHRTCWLRAPRLGFIIVATCSWTGRNASAPAQELSLLRMQP